MNLYSALLYRRDMARV